MFHGCFSYSYLLTAHRLSETRTFSLTMPNKPLNGFRKPKTRTNRATAKPAIMLTSKCISHVLRKKMGFVKRIKVLQEGNSL